MKALLPLAAAILAGCAGTPISDRLDSLPEFTRQDADTACRISREWNDLAGERCFCTLAEKRLIAPSGALSALAAVRAARVGRPPECAQVILDAQRRAARLGL